MTQCNQPTSRLQLQNADFLTANPARQGAHPANQRANADVSLPASAGQPQTLEFEPLGKRKIVADFDGGHITGNAGVLLLRQVEEHTGTIRQLTDCFTDLRDQKRIEHPLHHLVAQRIYGLALGYEDLNDHDSLRSDPLLAAAVGDDDPLGHERRCVRDQGKALAGRGTLNRLELTGVGGKDRYKKIPLSCAKVDNLFIDLFIQAHGDTPPSEIVLDLDATDDPIHGEQLGRFFHGYYDQYCFLPLYVMCGQFVLAAKLRSSNIDACAGSVPVLERIVTRIRQRWPGVRIIIRADGGFCREEIMSWCEVNGVGFALGMAKNARLLRAVGGEMQQARVECRSTGKAARVFGQLQYRTHKSWSRFRRVIAKAEALPDGDKQCKDNPRFVVTSISSREMESRKLYEEFYCARGEMENRIKEQQMCLFADRTSAQDMRANQIRLYFSTIAYTLLMSLRRLGLTGTDMSRARCDTIRNKCLKIGAQVRVSVRRIAVSMSSSHPLQRLFQHACAALGKLKAWSGASRLIKIVGGNVGENTGGKSGGNADNAGTRLLGLTGGP